MNNNFDSDCKGEERYDTYLEGEEMNYVKAKKISLLQLDSE